MSLVPISRHFASNTDFFQFFPPCLFDIQAQQKVGPWGPIPALITVNEFSVWDVWNMLLLCTFKPIPSQGLVYCYKGFERWGRGGCYERGNLFFNPAHQIVTCWCLWNCVGWTGIVKYGARETHFTHMLGNVFWGGGRHPPPPSHTIIFWRKVRVSVDLFELSS